VINATERNNKVILALTSAIFGTAAELFQGYTEKKSGLLTGKQR
jgi:hypothetical protein